MPTEPKPDECGRTTFATLARLEVTATPMNFAIWYEYHSGLNPELNHLIDGLQAKGLRFGDDIMAAIHKRFFSNGNEQGALQGVSESMLVLLGELTSQIGSAGADATRFGTTVHDTAHAFTEGTTSLAELITRLRQEARDMAERTELLGKNLASAADRIQTLERSLDDVRRDAATDGLTGLANRRSFDAMLREHAGQAMNSEAPICLLLLDIDHFKRFNDLWGHQVGDQVLRLVATTLVAQLRPEDIAARYGGEEFAIILPATPATAALRVAERIRTAFEGRRLVARSTGKTIDGVTFSIGGAEYAPGEALADWVERADKALYSVKNAGRNRAMMAPAEAQARSRQDEPSPPASMRNMATLSS